MEMGENLRRLSSETLMRLPVEANTLPNYEVVSLCTDGDWLPGQRDSKAHRTDQAWHDVRGRLSPSNCLQARGAEYLALKRGLSIDSLMLMRSNCCV